nr:MAG TPA_asm: hypothetical protein [Caudoviricetes sp.]
MGLRPILYYALYSTMIKENSKPVTFCHQLKFLLKQTIKSSLTSRNL